MMQTVLNKVILKLTGLEQIILNQHFSSHRKVMF